MTDVMDDKPKPETAKRKRIFRRLLLCAVIAAIAFFVVPVVRVWTGKPTISVDYVAELNKLTKPDNYDPNQNAAPCYEQALAAFIESRTVWHLTLPEEMNDVELGELRKHIEANAESIDLLKEAAAKPYCWVEHSTKGDGTWGITAFQPFYQGGLMRLLCLRAKLLAANGHVHEAFDDIYSTYRMGLQLSVFETQIGQIIGIIREQAACQTALWAIARLSLTPEQLTSAHQTFDELFYKSGSRMHLGYSKLGLYDTAQRLFTDDGKGSGHLILPEFYKLEREYGYPVFEYGRVERDDDDSSWLSDIFGIEKEEDTGQLSTSIRRTWLAMRGPDRKQALAEIEKYYAKLAELGQPTPWDLHEMGIESSEDVLQISDGNVFKEFLYNPVFLTVKQRMHGTQAALLTVLGILRCKADTGELPDSLEELLEAGYIKELPRDPYGPGSLEYFQNNDGFVLYSFGPDFDDDGSQKDDLIYWPVENEKKNEHKQARPKSLSSPDETR